MNSVPNVPQLSIVLPAYLEAKNLSILLPQLHEVIETLDVSYEIIVVDTIKPLDDTKEVCQKNETAYFNQRTIYLNREKSNSFGDAIRTGIKYSEGSYVIFMDSDGSHPPEFIKNLYVYKNAYDIVIASRYISGGSTENSWPLIFMSRVLNIIYSRILGIPCRDVSNSFKLYRGDWLRSLQLKCDHFDIVEEIMIKLLRQHRRARIKEVPFGFKKRIHGKTKRNLLLFMFTYFITLIKLKLLK